MSIPFKSLWSVYTLVFYALQSVLAWEDVVGSLRALDETEGRVEDILLTFNGIMYLVFHFLAPIICFAEWASVARYINSWREFEVCLLSLIRLLQ
jgi:hypothetical protein